MTICGTGHRPPKLGGYDNKEAFDLMVTVARAWLITHKPDIVISGMALGWDQALAKAALKRGIPLHCYAPCRGQGERWRPDAQRFYHAILARAAYVQFINVAYSPAATQRRNEAMVDACDTVLALWDGSPGGTGNCIRYAKKAGKPVVNLWEEFNR